MSTCLSRTKPLSKPVFLHGYTSSLPNIINKQNLSSSLVGPGCSLRFAATPTTVPLQHGDNDNLYESFT
ncbi:hypothetical protein L1887_27843 [Cichorium endivia]|nr:hypothetical protein L1887_27843 [Cichorium endivia]